MHNNPSKQAFEKLKLFMRVHNRSPVRIDDRTISHVSPLEYIRDLCIDEGFDYRSFFTFYMKNEYFTPKQISFIENMYKRTALEILVSEQFFEEGNTNALISILKNIEDYMPTPDKESAGYKGYIGYLIRMLQDGRIMMGNIPGNVSYKLSQLLLLQPDLSDPIAKRQSYIDQLNQLSDRLYELRTKFKDELTPINQE